MIRKILVIVFASVIGIAAPTWAQQETCATNLKRAEKLFDEGKLEDMHLLIAECMRHGFNKEQKLRAYELTIQAYLADENALEAEKRMMKLLKMDPTYSVEKKVLSAEFVNLYDQLKATPIISVGIIAGPSMSVVRVSEEFGVHDVETVHGEYTSKTGYSAGVLTQFYLSHSFLVDAEFSIVQNQYSYSLTDVLPGINTMYEETQRRFDIPVSLRYQHSFGRLSPYLQAGLAPGFVMQNTVTAERSYTSSPQLPVSSAELDVQDRRNSFTLQAFAGIGCSYRVKRSSVFATVRYSAAMTQYMAADAHRGDDAFTYKYYIIDDALKMHSYAFLCGYTFSFYKLNKKTDSQ